MFFYDNLPYYGTPGGVSGLDYPSWYEQTSNRYTRGLKRYTDRQSWKMKQDYFDISGDMSNRQAEAYERSMDIHDKATSRINDLIHGGERAIDKYLGAGEAKYDEIRGHIWGFYNRGLSDMLEAGKYYSHLLRNYYGDVRGDLKDVLGAMLRHSPKSKLITYDKIVGDAQKYADVFAQKFGASKYEGYDMSNPASRRMNVIGSKVTMAANKAGINLATVAAKTSNQALLDEYGITASGYRSLMSGIAAIGSTMLSGVAGIGRSTVSGIAAMASSGMSALGRVGAALIGLYGTAMSNVTSLYRQGIITEGQLANSLIHQQTSFMHDLATLGNTALASIGSMRAGSIAQYGALGRSKLAGIANMYRSHKEYLGELARSAAIEASAGKRAMASKYSADLMNQYRWAQLDDLNKYRAADLEIRRAGLDRLMSKAKAPKLTTPSLKEQADYIDAINKLLGNENIPDSIKSLAKSGLIKLFGVPENTFDPNKFMKILQGGNTKKKAISYGEIPTPGIGYNDVEFGGSRYVPIDTRTPSWVNPSTLYADRNAYNYLPPGSGLIVDPVSGKLGVLAPDGSIHIY